MGVKYLMSTNPKTSKTARITVYTPSKEKTIPAVAYKGQTIRNISGFAAWRIENAFRLEFTLSAAKNAIIAYVYGDKRYQEIITGEMINALRVMDAELELLRARKKNNYKQARNDFEKISLPLMLAILEKCGAYTNNSLADLSASIPCPILTENSPKKIRAIYAFTVKYAYKICVYEELMRIDGATIGQSLRAIFPHVTRKMINEAKQIMRELYGLSYDSALLDLSAQSKKQFAIIENAQEKLTDEPNLTKRAELSRKIANAQTMLAEIEKKRKPIENAKRENHDCRNYAHIVAVLGYIHWRDKCPID